MPPVYFNKNKLSKQIKVFEDRYEWLKKHDSGHFIMPISDYEDIILITKTLLDEVKVKRKKPRYLNRK